MIGAVVVIVVWYVMIAAFDIPRFFLPPPDAIMVAFVENWPDLLTHGMATTVESLGGLLLSIGVGALLALLMSELPLLSRTILPWLVMSQAVPKVAVAPLFVIWLGFGVVPILIIAFFISFFPIVIATAGGLNSVQPEEVDLFRTMTRRRWPIYRHLRIPRALPQFFDGVKVGTSLALIGAVVGEFVAGQQGLGYLVIVANRNLQIELMFAVFVALSLIGILLFYAVVLIERLAIPWYRAQRRGTRGLERAEGGAGVRAPFSTGGPAHEQ